jgi:hypothetical protein
MIKEEEVARSIKDLTFKHVTKIFAIFEAVYCVNQTKQLTQEALLVLNILKCRRFKTRGII